MVLSGFASKVKTEAEKAEHCKEYERVLGMMFTPDEIMDTPGAQYAAKIGANARWGRYIPKNSSSDFH